MEIQQEILSDITVHMKYAKWKEAEQRKETWEEICNRNRDMHLNHIKTMTLSEVNKTVIEAKINSVYDEFVIPKKVLPSMRSMQFAGKPLFENVSAKFESGKVYGLIGANGSGKSTFMKILSGKLEATSGNVNIPDQQRLAALSQDQFAFNDFSVLDVVKQISELWEDSTWKIQNKDNQFFESKLLKLNCDKALYNLGWKPSFDFDEGIKYTVNWYLKNKKWLLKN